VCVYRTYKIWLIIVFFVFIFFCCGGEKRAEEEVPLHKQTIEDFTLTLTHKGELKMILKSKFAVIHDNIADLSLPVIKFYNEGRYVSTLSAESAEINMETYDAECRGRCDINTVNNEKLQTRDLVYNAKEKFIYSDNEVKFSRRGETLYGTSFRSDTKLNKIVIKNQRIILD
jgi:LPS export ABC transporter protein LptC